jgi:hypothetical protein
LADSEVTTPATSTSTPAARKKRAPRRRAAAGTARARKGSGRKTTAASRSRSRSKVRTTRQSKNALAEMLKTLQKRAAGTSTRIVKLSGESAQAARKAVGTVTASSRKTILGVKREWNRMDTPSKLKFVGVLLGTLAAASGAAVASRRRK